jgi:hypothetical protein
MRRGDIFKLKVYIEFLRACIQHDRTCRVCWSRANKTCAFRFQVTPYITFENTRNPNHTATTP